MNQVSLQACKMGSRGQAVKLNALAAGLFARLSGTEQQILLRHQTRLLSTSMKMFDRPKDGEVHPGYAKLRAKMEKFQIDDGVPVHLKGGPTDKILYVTTFILCFIGLAGCFQLYYQLAFPKKK